MEQKENPWTIVCTNLPGNIMLYAFRHGGYTDAFICGRCSSRCCWNSQYLYRYFYHYVFCYFSRNDCGYDAVYRCRKRGIAYQARQLGMLFNAIVGAILAVFLFFQSGMILSAVGVADSLMEYAKTYLRIVGGGCILNALIPIFSSYLRAFGYTRQPLVATVSANILNFILNAVFLFGFHYGVAGVAAATVISRVLNLGLVICFGHYYIHAKEKKERLKNRVVFGQIVKIGLPSAMETALYNVAMTLIIRFLNQMDANGMNVTARSYAIQITNFSYCVGAALAQANAIMVGWRIGAQDYEACDKGTRKAAVVGVIVATILESIFALSSHWLIRMFTDDPQMVSLVGKLLAIDIVLEIGRVTNLVYGNALKTSGDAVFTTVIAAIFMYLCAVGDLISSEFI